VTKKRSTRQKAPIDLGPMETIADLQEALRRLARACVAGENVDDCARAGEVVGELLRFKLAEEEQRLERALRGH
jgi:hypothetical protein